MNPRSVAYVVSMMLLTLLGTSCGLFDEPEPEVIDPTRSYECSADGAPAAVAYDDDGRPYVAGRFLVGYHDRDLAGMRTTSSGQRDTMLRSMGLRTLRRISPTIDLVAVDGDPRLAVRQLGADARVAFAHPDYLLSSAAQPDDPEFHRQWYLQEYGATAAWDVRSSADGRVVAVVDSGFDVTHPDLADRLLPGWDFCYGDADVSAPNQHGTHVAGIIGAIGDNGIGISGVARGSVDLLPVKIFSENGLSTATSDAVAGILWAAGLSVPDPTLGRAPPPPNPYPADVINLSFGGHGRIASLDQAVCEARDTGALVIASTGNWNPYEPINRVMSPANGPCAFAVGSVGESTSLSPWSLYTPGAEEVDVVAPGEAIYSTVPFGAYASISGTSMAAPYVAGAAALLLAHDVTRTAEDVALLLKATAWRPRASEPPRERHDDGSTIAERYGAGIVCIHAALDPSVFDPATGAGCGPAVEARAD